MRKAESKQEIISRLKNDLLRWQGYDAPEEAGKGMGLGPLEEAFPNGVFPRGAIHEFMSMEPEEAAASSGFITGLLGSLMGPGSACIWVSASRNVFPPSLKSFGVEPDQILFADLRHERDVLWAVEEGLKCTGLAAVVAELRDLDFIQSRRLQLAVEKSKVTGLLLRNRPRYTTPTASMARWHIKPAPSQLEAGMPGVGFPRWHVELVKVRNGYPGSWLLEWSGGQFRPVSIITPAAAESASFERKTG